MAGFGAVLYRWRWPVIGAWLVLVLAGALLGGRLFDRLGNTDNLRPDAESQRAQDRIDQLLPSGPVVIAVVGDRDPYDPPLVASVTAVSARLRALPTVAEVDNLYDSPGGRVGADNRSSLIRVELVPGLPRSDTISTEDRVAAELRTIEAPRILVGGEGLTERAFADRAVEEAARGETVALVVLLVVLVAILGGLVAALIPLAAACTAIAVTLLGLLGLTSVLRVGEFTVNVVTLLGIGLAVDYTLLMVMRFQEERAKLPATTAGTALAKAPATVELLVSRTVAGAGPTVLVAGIAVAATMTGLHAFGDPLLASMALGGALVGVLATAVALTAVPALIAVTHRRIPAPGRLTRWIGRSPRTPERSLLGRLAALAQRRPVPVAAATTAALLLLASPFVFGVNVAESDARALPRSMAARELHDVLSRDFEAGRADPVVVVVTVDPASVPARELLNRLTGLPHVRRVQPRPDVPPDAMVIDVTPAGTTGGAQSRELVRAVRALDTPVPLLVGGAAAELVDHTSTTVRRLPLVSLVLVVVTGVLLFALTGSVVIPVKALLLNALTLLATLGVLVLVFQWGVGAALLDLEPWGAIDATTPALLFVFAFALTMDYEVILLARIQQERSTTSGDRRGDARDRRGDARDRRGDARGDRAVVAGISHSGRVVTAAAGCMMIVFLGFLLGELRALREIGFGMVVAVVLDVTVVRGLLLPALMTLLGERNWWAPAVLRRWPGIASTVDEQARVSDIRTGGGR